MPTHRKLATKIVFVSSVVGESDLKSRRMGSLSVRKSNSSSL